MVFYREGAELLVLGLRDRQGLPEEDFCRGGKGRKRAAEARRLLILMFPFKEKQMFW